MGREDHLNHLGFYGAKAERQTMVLFLRGRGGGGHVLPPEAVTRPLGTEHPELNSVFPTPQKSGCKKANWSGTDRTIKVPTYRY